jgi:CubicO group peptidase (beta-lactamase class C family)
MKRFIRGSQLTGIFLLSTVAAAQILSDAEIANRINAYLTPFVATGNFTGTVLVARRGSVLLRQGYGMANYELRVPNSPETRFHIASVSKPFTAAAILQLQEQGRVKLSDYVSRFLPEFPNGNRITLDHLLTHTSDPQYQRHARLRCLRPQPADNLRIGSQVRRIAAGVPAGQ